MRTVGIRGVASASSSSYKCARRVSGEVRRCEGPAVGVLRVSARLGGECLVSLRRGIGKLGEVSMLDGEQRRRPDAE